MPKRSNTVRLTLYLNNSTVLTDGKAVVADTEVLTDLLDGSSFPRRKTPTLSHNHRATGQGPTPDNYKQIERRDPPYPDMDRQFATRSGGSAFHQARQGMHREKAIHNGEQQRQKFAAVLGSTIILIMSIVFAIINSGPAEEELPTQEAPVEQPLPTIAPPLGYGLTFTGRRDVNGG